MVCPRMTQVSDKNRIPWIEGMTPLLVVVSINFFPFVYIEKDSKSCAKTPKIKQQKQFEIAVGWKSIYVGLN